MERDGVFPVVDAGTYPRALLEVCQLWNTQPEKLLGWSVRRDGVSIILPSGAKVGASVRGCWREETSAGASAPAEEVSTAGGAEAAQAAQASPGKVKRGK